MKKLIALVLTLMFTLTAVAALAEAPATTDTPSRTLVVYYSATGSTERIRASTSRAGWPTGMTARRLPFSIAIIWSRPLCPSSPSDASRTM